LACELAIENISKQAHPPKTLSLGMTSPSAASAAFVFLPIKSRVRLRSALQLNQELKMTYSIMKVFAALDNCVN
jgi:hypothetical protein